MGEEKSKRNGKRYEKGWQPKQLRTATSACTKFLEDSSLALAAIHARMEYHHSLDDEFECAKEQARHRLFFIGQLEVQLNKLARE